MIIISHRGYWKTLEERNSLHAFRRSFSMGFGTETDVRDCAGELVISHDMPSGNEVKFEDFLELYCKYEKSLPLALNIKSDGLQIDIQALLEKYSITNYFTFDMAMPDMLGYIQMGIKTFVRASEFEAKNSLWAKADGVWLDGFSRLDINEDLLSDFIDAGKLVCIVSPELHGRNVSEEWTLIKGLSKNILTSSQLILCTDIPEDAMEYFKND